MIPIRVQLGELDPPVIVPAGALGSVGTTSAVGPEGITDEVEDCAAEVVVIVVVIGGNAWPRACLKKRVEATRAPEMRRDAERVILFYSLFLY